MLPFILTNNILEKFVKFYLLVVYLLEVLIMKKSDLVMENNSLTIKPENQVYNLLLPLTDDEAEVLENYLFKKICKLEDAGLTDSHCYPLLCSIRRKLLRSKKAFTKE